MLSRLLIWTLFNFSRCCLTSFFITYGKLSNPSTTLHEVNASCFVLNTEQKKTLFEHLCVLYITLYSFTAPLLEILCVFSSYYYLSCIAIHLPFFSFLCPHFLLLPMCVLYVLVSFLFSFLIPCLILSRILSWPFLVCIWVMMTSWEFRRIFVKTPSYFVKTCNINLFCWFLVFVPTVALNFGKMILQTFQISCKICACVFR